jgi:thiol-disulfide isomerase/thioredoxin
MKKISSNILVAAVTVLIVAGGVFGYFLSNKDNNTDKKNMTDSSSEKTNQKTEPMTTTTQNNQINEGNVAGSYQEYSQDKIGDASYGTTIVFFHATWCPECRAFDKAISSENIPDGVLILKADFDSETELRKKYGVTQQTTFVKIDSEGKEISQWSGYGKDKSVQAILDNLK